MDQTNWNLLEQNMSAAGVPAVIRDPDLMRQAFIHPTWAIENRLPPGSDNQRLEFLGDAVLGLMAGELLYRLYPDRPEGDLTSIRAVAVSEATLSRLATELGLGGFLLLGRGEEKSGGRWRPSILADVFEAWLGALYLQTDFTDLRHWISGLLEPVVLEIVKQGYKDPKTRLQEMVQDRHKRSVVYRILEESGPDHDKTFTAAVVWEDEIVAVGRGKSKKEAERAAAAQAVDWFRLQG